MFDDGCEAYQLKGRGTDGRAMQPLEVASPSTRSLWNVQNHSLLLRMRMPNPRAAFQDKVVGGGVGWGETAPGEGQERGL